MKKIWQNEGDIMGTIVGMFGILLISFIVLTLYACLVVGSRADDKMEELAYQLQQEKSKEDSQFNTQIENE